MMITATIIISIVCIFLGGSALAFGHGVTAVALTALGVGWLAILFSALRRVARQQINSAQ